MHSASELAKFDTFLGLKSAQCFGVGEKTRKKSKKVKKRGGSAEFPVPGNRDDLFFS